MANGVLGNLNAWLENKRRVAGRQLRDLMQSPDDFGRMQAARFEEDQTKYMSDPAAGLDFVAGPLGALAGVIKPRGGNWMTGSVEDALKGLKYNGPIPRVEDGVFRRPPEQVALNQWIEGPLTKYIKRDMATPGDPVRALAEQGILHIDPAQLNFNELMAGRHLGRADDMMPGHGYQARSPMAQIWEGVSDNSVAEIPGKYVPESLREKGLPVEDWVRKLDPESNVYEFMSPQHFANDVGFDHLRDELRNALNPESGLPRNLQLRPEQLQQMGMEKAVRHVAKINDWRAAQKAELNKSLAEKGSIVREYTENNPKGLKWVELKPGSVTDEVLSKLSDSDRRAYERYLASGDDPVEAIRAAAGDDNPIVKELQEHLKYEGDTMGHCVGGYCSDVLEGRSRIFSLRDAKGEPHVTVEVGPGDLWHQRQGSVDENPLVKQAWADYAKKVKWLPWEHQKALEAFPNWMSKNRPEDFKKVKEFFESTQLQIYQIKGKQNRAPNEEYLPFVQDFVRNSPFGPWSEVGDIRNTGLISKAYLTPEEMAIPNLPNYLTMDEIKKLREGKPWTPIDQDLDDWKDGGLFTEDDWDTFTNRWALKVGMD